MLYAANFKPLNDDQKKRLENHEMVVTTKELKDSTWPEVQMRRIVKADPLTSVAIFLALDHQKEYVPNLIKSMPSKIISPTEIYTDYEMKLPWPLSNSVYTHASKLSKQKECYRVDWYMVKSNTASVVKGFATFCPHPKGTFVKYQSFIEPKSIFAGFFEGTMISDASGSIETIMKYIETCKKSKKSLVNKYSKFILDSLNGISVYQNLVKKNQ